MVFKLQIRLMLCVPKTFDYFTYLTSAKTKLNQVEFNRSQSCSLLVPDLTQPCRNCKSFNVRVTFLSQKGQFGSPGNAESTNQIYIIRKN